MIGARDMAFPRLNALLVLAVPARRASSSTRASSPRAAPAKAGWTAYPPLSENAVQPGQRRRTSGSSRCTSSPLASLAGAINFIATIHNMRTPGMTWMRMPLFVWSIDVYAWLLVVILPGDRRRPACCSSSTGRSGTHFFIPDQGGSALLYQHIFWFFGHPEVYVMILPGDGDHLRDHPGLRAQADLRLQGGRVLDASASRSSRCSSGRTTCSRSGSAGASRATS